MGRHTVTQQVPCDRCGNEALLTYVAASRPQGLRFSSEFHCSRCGITEALDGPALTSAARAAFEHLEGRWMLRLRTLGPRRLEALQALRASGLRLPEIARLAREGGVLLGVLVEIEQVAQGLAAIGAELEIVRAGA